MRFTTDIFCKRYAAHFLEISYPNAEGVIDISGDKFLYSQLVARIGRPNFKNKAKLSALYSQKIKLSISTRCFYRKGWQLSNDNMVQFNKLIEAQCKHFMYLQVSTAVVKEQITAKQSIINFQEEFGFTEDIWAYDSIWQEYNRKNKRYEKNRIKR